MTKGLSISMLAVVALVGCAASSSEADAPLLGADGVHTDAVIAPSGGGGIIVLSNLDDPGYFDVGDGPLQIYKSDIIPGTGPNFIKLPVQPIMLKTSFDAGIKAEEATICDRIRAQLAGQASSFAGCTWPDVSSAVLKAKVTRTNVAIARNDELSLRYVLSGASFSFTAVNDTTPGYADPTIHMTFDLVIEQDFAFDIGVNMLAPTYDPDYSGTPIQNRSTTVRFRNAKASGPFYVPEPKLQAGESQLNSTFVDVSTPGPEVDMNRALHAQGPLLVEIERFIDPNAGGWFALDLAMEPDDSGMRLVLRRDGNGAMPPSQCRLSVVCGDQVYGACTIDSGKLLMQRLRPKDGAWITVSDPNAVAVEDTSPDGSDTATYRFCDSNVWGGSCGAPLPPVTLPHQTCTGGGGGLTHTCGAPPLPRCVTVTAN